MDALLNQLTHYAVNYAIRSGIAITSGYALKQCGRLLKEAPQSQEREQLARLHQRLESKIRVISPSIDMIELIAVRGNTSLEPAVSLTKNIRYHIQRLAVRFAKAANDEEVLRRNGSRVRSHEEVNRVLKGIVIETEALLARIEDAVPLINLAITTSGVNLSTKLSGNVSPSRLLQASTFLTAADTSYTGNPHIRQQVGPTYTLSVYMLFSGHARPSSDHNIRGATWKEVLHKARVKLWRVPLEELYSLPDERSNVNDVDLIPSEDKTAEFAYQIVLIEDLDDGRVHTIEEAVSRPLPTDDVPNAGIRDVIPVHEISKVFYADTGKILNIETDGEANNPVLLIKRDIEAEPPRRLLERSQSSLDFSNSKAAVDWQVTDRSLEPDSPERSSTPWIQTKAELDPDMTWRLPANLDPEWLALEVFTEEADSGSEDEEPSDVEKPSSHRAGSLEPGILSALSHLALRSSPSVSPSSNKTQLISCQQPTSQSIRDVGNTQMVKSSLSLLEMLLKLAALQQFRQDSHLAIEDELLNFFLEESGTAGTGVNKERRHKVRHDAMRRVGFDPYDESPIKRRGEQYIEHARHSPAKSHQSPRASHKDLAYDDDYECGDSSDDSPPGLMRATSGGLSPCHDSPSLLSPRPRPAWSQQTPSRSSTPGSTSDTYAHALTMHDGASATPPGKGKNRSADLRSEGKRQPQSPLAHEIINHDTSDDLA